MRDPVKRNSTKISEKLRGKLLNIVKRVKPIVPEKTLEKILIKAVVDP